MVVSLSVFPEFFCNKTAKARNAKQQVEVVESFRATLEDQLDAVDPIGLQSSSQSYKTPDRVRMQPQRIEGDRLPRSFIK